MGWRIVGLSMGMCIELVGVVTLTHVPHPGQGVVVVLDLKGGGRTGCRHVVVCCPTGGG